MTFLVALAMGTMYCVTVIQFIPEALGKRVFLRSQKASKSLGARLSISIWNFPTFVFHFYLTFELELYHDINLVEIVLLF